MDLSNLGHSTVAGIDLEAEELNTLSYWARNLPGGRKAVHVQTLHRWRLKGFRGGDKLICIRRGLEWETSREALLRFFQRLNPAPVMQETPAQRSRRNEAAKWALAQMGIGTGRKTKSRRRDISQEIPRVDNSGS